MLFRDKVKANQLAASWRGQVESRQPHKLESAGSTPAAATNTPNAPPNITPNRAALDKAYRDRHKAERRAYQRDYMRKRRGKT